MNTRYIVGILVIVVLAGIGIGVAIVNPAQSRPTPTENPTATSTGVVAQKGDLIKVSSPRIGADVSSPLIVEGEARGNWFFEASFPVYLTDWDGKIIGQGIAQADGEWMTTNYVPFKATITFNKADISGQYSDRGTLILKKDNPSGLPEHDDALEFQVKIK